MRTSCELPSAFALNVSPAIELELSLLIYAAPLRSPHRLKLRELCCPWCRRADLVAVARHVEGSGTTNPPDPQWTVATWCSSCERRLSPPKVLTVRRAGLVERPTARA